MGPVPQTPNPNVRKASNHDTGTLFGGTATLEKLSKIPEVRTIHLTAWYWGADN